MLPVAVLILATAADFGRALTAYIEIGSAARTGAAYGSQSLKTAVNADGGIQTAALADASAVWGDPVTVRSPVLGIDSYGYTYVEVTVDYTFTPIMGAILSPAIGGSSMSMDRTVRMRVIN